MSQTVNPKTGEIQDAAAFMVALRDLDERIEEADRVVGELKENLKIARRHREGLVSELRAAARGDRALPFTEAPDTPATA